jgi:cob(I)alamin adenosyltransferase
MKIYTKTGDQGKTGLYQGPRVSKNHPNIHAYGTVDELNAVLGMARNQTTPKGDFDQALKRVQNDLFALGADLATPLDQNPDNRFRAALVEQLEQDIDRWEDTLTPLQSFILPGGHPLSSALHHARTVCRRAERACTDLLELQQIHMPCYQYINRLSDWLFVLARRANHVHNVEDTPWKP